MARYLAPEKPRHSSSTSEEYFRRRSTLFRTATSTRQTRFGQSYERQVCFHLATIGEIICTEKICLIADQSQWASILEEQLFLTEKVDFVDAIRPDLSSSKNYDRIILLNSLEKTSVDQFALIEQCRRSLTKMGQLILIHRDPHLNTLPLPSELRCPWLKQAENCLPHLIDYLQRRERRHIEVTQQIQTIKFSMTKFNWFSLLYQQAFYPLNLIDRTEIVNGLRRLNETYFKYHQDPMEISDRLMFIVMPRRVESLHFPLSSVHSLSTTSELEQLQRLKIVEPARRNLFASSFRFGDW